MNVVLFEDDYFADLLPLVYFRPVWELRCGALTLAEKIARYVSPKEPLRFLARTYLQQNYIPEERHLDSPPEETIFVNGAVLARPELKTALQNLEEGQCLIAGERLVAFRDRRGADSYRNADGVVMTDRVRDSLTSQSIDIPIIRYIWDAIDWMEEELQRDFQFRPQQSSGKIYDGVHLLEREQICVADGAVIKPGVVLDAEAGPIWIDEGAEVMPNSVIIGPAFIGKCSRIKVGAKIYGPVCIGPVCKIGGEVEGSTILGYSNKQHDGFLGHAYLGSWVNLGADTNNSDLKNNYGRIRVFLNGREIDTGKQFLGLIMGDHSKTAINTMFNTGTIVGVNCNIFGAEMPPKFVPSFSWGGATKWVDYDLQKAIQVAKIVMGRRNVTFGEREERLFRAVHALARKIERRG
ncbi:MAG: hypothetical protein GXO78_09140 [Calditrichaeota bacterium]|nr:hypothetical protein [Calditrichota bacterium]